MVDVSRCPSLERLRSLRLLPVPWSLGISWLNAATRSRVSCRRTAAIITRGRSSSSRRRTGSPSLNVIGVESKKIKAVRAVARLSPARNPLAHHSDYFGACAVEANAAPRPFCAAARPIGPPGSSAAWGGVSRRGGTGFGAPKSAAGPATALVGAPCNKRVLRAEPVLLLFLR